MNVKPKRRIRSPAWRSRNFSMPMTSIFISSSSAYVRSTPNIENPRMPAPRAENIVLSLITEGLSMISIGSRAAPVNEETIFTSVFCCEAAVSRSRKMRETAWPVVPDEVSVLKTDSSATLRSSSDLKSVQNPAIGRAVRPMPAGQLLELGREPCGLLRLVPRVRLARKECRQVVHGAGNSE